ncbi:MULTISPECIES: flagellar basal body rod protein FlgF [Chromobacterium]|uniref:Flagellar basal-body rod protein FlgF n=1 Tax=Chromobacterium aquaticum TaxID=467180 RepID=A0ABV8ZXH4_9NEIS|nr:MULTISPECIES: flagellar basal body rod protein FlgF [Chromobacterium]KMN34931.1 flagellar basal body rod protein FlgF [Chromobacterium sp. LK1]MCD5361183.1 flagellar basal body rod protein FlgF [Chromobacterium aquaticum]
MDRMLYLAMNGAKHVMWQQATTANNLANVHTNGFKADVVAFRALPVVGEGAPTRTYVVDNTVGHDLSQGSLMHTGNTSDFAIGSKGFFAVQAPDGGEAYTRDGGYVLDATGMMRTRSGLPIMGDGGPIVVPTGSRIQLGADGSVVATPQSGTVRTPQLVGQIKMVNPGPKEVYKGEDGLFRINGGGNAAADANVKLVPETLEASNVNSVESLVQMISHARQYDLNVRLMQTAQQGDQQAAQLLSTNG